MREVPHFSEHKSRAVGTQTPSHLLCQEKTHQHAYQKVSGSFRILRLSLSHTQKKSLSSPRSTCSLARSHLLRTDKPCTTVNITRKRIYTINKRGPVTAIPSSPSV